MTVVDGNAIDCNNFVAEDILAEIFMSGMCNLFYFRKSLPIVTREKIFGIQTFRESFANACFGSGIIIINIFFPHILTLRTVVQTL